jgi:hypothetical protein
MYSILNTKKTIELYLVKRGLFSLEYELTDRVNLYGKLSRQRFFRRDATAVSATETWIFKRGPFFSRTIFITNLNGEILGKATREWFSRKTLLTLNTGFTAEFYRPLIFLREYIWQSENYGEITSIEKPLISLTSIIHIKQNNLPDMLIPLLIFLGSYIAILRRRRKAAH